MDSLGHQHHAKKLSAVMMAWGIRAMGFTSISHFRSANFESTNTLSKYESKATLPTYVGNPKMWVRFFSG